MSSQEEDDVVVSFGSDDSYDGELPQKGPKEKRPLRPPSSSDPSSSKKPKNPPPKQNLVKPTAQLLHMPDDIYRHLQLGIILALRTEQIRKFRGNQISKDSYNRINLRATNRGVPSLYQLGSNEDPTVWLYPDGTVQLNQGNNRCEWLYRNGYVWMAFTVVVKSMNAIPTNHEIKCKPVQYENSLPGRLFKDMSYDEVEKYLKENLKSCLENWLGLEVLDLDKEYKQEDFKREPIDPKKIPFNYTYTMWYNKCSELGCEQKAQWQCSGCNMAFYCSQECQKKHWHTGPGGHAKECK